MTATIKGDKFDICTACGAHLDKGEQCDCEEERRAQKPTDEKKTK